ncbi:type II secretion system protein GspF [Aliidongia dinghuensis]|uniref:Type II secretion system protein GspF n=1 Tax=Aliidongia dinghuensis TaxID=1867774 RepID=A0A8J2YVY6_9PROT|nr:type II secretion system F family protein [Aliidongia dinghuensis]GGF23650.1 type II secretion system protein GspF [Aliidongia dinghuensis]
MPAFRFTAIDPQGQVQRGVMEAPDQAAVIDRLQRQGHMPMRAEPATGGGWSALFTAELGRRRGLSRQEMTDVTRELSTMLAAGQDLDRALRFIVETAPNPRVAKIMDRVRERVRGGNALAAALAQEPQSFPKLHVGLVRAGEAGGALAETLDRLAGLLERERTLAATVQSALIYPALLLTAAIGSIAVLIGYVLPQFVPLFAESGAELPLMTKLLIDFGDTMQVAGPWLLILLLILGVALRHALKNDNFRRPFDRFLLRVPVLGGLMRESLAARFTRTLGTLLKNGVPLIGALGIVNETIGNLAAVDAIGRATDSAKGGAGLSRPLGEAHIFPERTIHLLRLGEETAQLAAMALKAADIHEEKTRIAVQRLVALLVPTITIAMGIAVATIVGSLLMAMLGLNDLAL